VELRARNGSGRESDVLATYASHLRLRRYAVFQGHTVDGDGGAGPPPAARACARVGRYGDATARIHLDTPIADRMPVFSCRIEQDRSAKNDLMFEMPSRSRLPRGPRTCESGRAHGDRGSGDGASDPASIRPRPPHPLAARRERRTLGSTATY
jgi:hypothetical protein